MTISLRGFQLAPTPTQAAIAEALGLGAKLLRVQLLSQSEDITQWKRELEDQLNYFREFVYTSIPYDVKVVINLHRAPGDLENLEVREAIRWFWREVLFHFANKSNIVFGVLNEPEGSAKTVNSLMNDIFTLIRGSHCGNVISVTCPYSDPSKFNTLKYLNDPSVWYEVHFYLPLSFTHQGIYQYPAGKLYPTLRNSALKLKENFLKVAEFKKKYPFSQIYVGEFSCSNHTDSKSKSGYIRDCIIRFSKVKANWTYHAYGEAEVWQPDADILKILTNNLKGS